MWFDRIAYQTTRNSPMAEDRFFKHLTHMFGKQKSVESQMNKSQGINESANFRFLQRLSVIFGFRRNCPRSIVSCRYYHPRKKASCRECPCDPASCRESLQEAKTHGQSLQEAINQAKQSRQEARYRGQSRRKPNMSDSLCRNVN